MYQLGRRPVGEYLAGLQEEDFMVRYQTLSGLSTEIRPEDRGEAIAALERLLEREENPGVRGNAEAELKRLQQLEAEHAVS